MILTFAERKMQNPDFPFSAYTDWLLNPRLNLFKVLPILSSIYTMVVRVDGEDPTLIRCDPIRSPLSIRSLIFIFLTDCLD